MYTASFGEFWCGFALGRAQGGDEACVLLEFSLSWLPGQRLQGFMLLYSMQMDGTAVNDLLSFKVSYCM